MKVSTKVILIFSLLIFYLPETFSQTPTGRVPNLNLERSHTHSGVAPNLASIAYGYSSIQETTLSMPIPTGTPFTLLAPYISPGFASSMCEGGDGTYYVTDHSGPSLYKFEPGTGHITFIGNITGLSGEQPHGIAYNPANGLYYICTRYALYSFDVNTFVATFIGSFGITNGAMIDLCFDANGVCYAYDVQVDNAYTLDITTGVPTLLGPLGYSAAYGQGMSYDFETNTIYLTAYNTENHTAQLRIMDPTTGNTTLVTDWGFDQVAPFAIDSNPGPPCPVGASTNPDPINGTEDVSVVGTTLNWSNGDGTTNVEIWLGPSGNISKIYDGSVITSWLTDTLSYQTTYQWQIVCKNDTCSTSGPFWYFETELDSGFVFVESFDNMNCWTPIGPWGTTNWSISNTNNALGSPTSELRLAGYEPAFMGLSKLLSCTINDTAYHYIVRLRHMCDVYSSTSSTDMGIAVTYDGGTTKEIIWQFHPITGNVGPEEIETEFYPTSNSFQLILFLNGFSGRINYWYVDDIQLFDDCLQCFPPPAPYNVNAQNISYSDPEVLISWSDSAWNEEAYNIIRKNGIPNDPGQYELIGTVPFNVHYYVDTTVVTDSTYTYGVIAYNQYGYSDTSNTATILVEPIPIPVELTSFYSEINNDIVTLYWETATETNNQGFEIERKLDNAEWTLRGFKNGAGTTTEPQNYSFIDDVTDVSAKLISFRLKQIDFDGSFEYSDVVLLENLAAVDYELSQNFPNPFNPSTTIKYSIPNLVFVTIKVFNVLGKEVAILVNEEKPAGKYEVEFEESNLPSGIYFYKLQAGSFIETKKMVLLK